MRPRRRGAGRVDAAEGPRHVLGDARERGEAREEATLEEIDRVWDQVKRGEKE